MEPSIQNLQNQNSHTDMGDRNTNNEIIIVRGSTGLIAKGLINKLTEQYHVAGLDEVGYLFTAINL